MNLLSVIILILVGAWFVYSLVYMAKHRNISGCGGCNGDCSRCHSHCNSNLKIDIKK